MASGAATGDEPDARPATAADADVAPIPAVPGGETSANARVHRNATGDRNGDAASDAIGDAIGDANSEAVERLAGEVLRYLQRHPNATDTVHGIAQWWIARQRLVETRAQVRAALDRLVARHLVEASDTADGRSCYRLRRDAPAFAAGGASADADFAAAPDADAVPDASRTPSPPNSSTADPMTSDRADHAPASDHRSSAVASSSDAPIPAAPIPDGPGPDAPGPDGPGPDAPGPDAPDAAPMNPSPNRRSGGD